MKEYSPDKIRNIALVAHQDTGKTTLGEALLFSTGAISRMGRIADGNTALDSSPDEIARQITIQAALAFCEFKGYKINVLDTPGYEDFVGEVICSLDVVEGAVIVVRADGGVEVGTEKVWTYVRERNLPSAFCINKMDKEHASFKTTVEQLRSFFGPKVLPVIIPIGEGESFKGVVDVIRGKAYEYSGDGLGKVTEVAVPADMKDAVAEWRHELLETAAESSESLMEKYLETETLPDDELIKGLAAGVHGGEVYPVFCTCAEKNIGAEHFLQTVVDFMPSPAQRSIAAMGPQEEVPCDPKGPIAAFVFKNMSESHVGDMLFLRVYRGQLSNGKDVYNVNKQTGERLGQMYCIQGKTRKETEALGAGDLGAVVKLKNTKIGDSLCDKSKQLKFRPTDFPKPSIFSAIEGQAKADEEKIGTGLNRLVEEDPTFSVQVDPEIRQTLISGQGELHLDVITGKLKRRFGVEVILSKPRIPYRETIKKSAEAQGKYKKQSGGRGQYGDVWVKIEPLPRGAQFEFVDGIVGGVVPGKFIPAVEKGIIGAMKEGVVAGYPLVDVKATLYDGTYHTVDSSEQAFKVAGSMAIKKAVLSAAPVLLEPIVNVEVKVPEEFMGDVMGDLSSRRGKIQGMEPSGRFNIVRCQVPLAELYRYSTHLRSISQGRGTHKREFSHYEEVPHEIAQKIIEEAKKEKEEKNQ
ncbi:MAG: elongation factor G [Chitinivibrionia bacterium]|nr:elongation factor G [Chitinivibrionia bacterium]